METIKLPQPFFALLISVITHQILQNITQPIFVYSTINTKSVYFFGISKIFIFI
ncbi:hypothetical protein CCAND95_70025 [Capnocytophaga canis]|nr:hypothetical protein CCAND95_70025 [Capnocytophaga canis]